MKSSKSQLAKRKTCCPLGRGRVESLALRLECNLSPQKRGRKLHKRLPLYGGGVRRRMVEDPMTNKDKFLRVLYAHSDRERLINFKLFPGSDRNTTSSEVYEALADSITKERMGRLKEIKLEEEEKDLKDLSLDDIKRM
ncbi:MAG: hypothetical protein IID61_18020 [SAR324 cluster bacterium]|nr:hypothetical protein [SAR324 cluster bacterium]